MSSIRLSITTIFVVRAWPRRGLPSVLGVAARLEGPAPSSLEVHLEVPEVSEVSEVSEVPPRVLEVTSGRSGAPARAGPPASPGPDPTGSARKRWRWSRTSKYFGVFGK